MDDTIVYQNVNVGEGRVSPDGGATFEGVLAQVDAQRGGTIISDGLAYYVSLQRLVLSTRLPTLIAELAVPTATDTVYKITMVVILSSAFTFTAALRLPKLGPDLKLQNGAAAGRLRLCGQHRAIYRNVERSADQGVGRV